jgi:hypothetical protein
MIWRQSGNEFHHPAADVEIVTPAPRTRLPISAPAGKEIPKYRGKEGAYASIRMEAPFLFLR